MGGTEETVTASRPTFEAQPSRGGMWEETARRICMANRHMSFNISLHSILVIINRAIGTFGLVVLPFGLVRHLIVCPWCDDASFLDQVPIFSVLLEHNQIAISDLCLLELTCGLALLFRIFYVCVAHESIVDDRVSRIRGLGREPKKQLIKVVIFAIVMTFVWLGDSFFPVSWAFISSHGSPAVAFCFMFAAFLFFYMTPEIVIYVWYIVTKKLETR